MLMLSQDYLVQGFEELWSRHNVLYDRFKTYGCESYVHVPKELLGNLELKYYKCIFFSYGLDGQILSLMESKEKMYSS